MRARLAGKQDYKENRFKKNTTICGRGGWMACVYTSCYVVYLAAQNIHAVFYAFACLQVYSSTTLVDIMNICLLSKNTVFLFVWVFFWLCFSEIEKGKGFGPAVEGTLIPSPCPGLDSLFAQVWLQFARCLHVQIYDLSQLCWTKEGIEGKSIYWAQFLWAPLNWCQNVSVANPKCIRRRRWISAE